MYSKITDGEQVFFFFPPETRVQFKFLKDFMMHSNAAILSNTQTYIY